MTNAATAGAPKPRQPRTLVGEGRAAVQAQRPQRGELADAGQVGVAQLAAPRQAELRQAPAARRFELWVQVSGFSGRHVANAWVWLMLGWHIFIWFIHAGCAGSFPLWHSWWDGKPMCSLL